MKKILLFGAIISIFALSACGPKEKKPEGQTETEPVEISFYSYPVGGWSSKSAVSTILTGFHNKYPLIHVNYVPVDYTTGDSEIEDAIKRGEAPDVVFEGPERLVANWAARSLMVSLNDLWESEEASKIYENVEVACKNTAGDYFVYPVCMTTHCMAINRDLFEKAGAWEFVDEENHTWTTDGFISAVKKLTEFGVEDVGKLYCNGQSGDQGTRALVNNLYSGTFTNREHTAYTVNSPENIKALELLCGLEGIEIDPRMTAQDEINAFCAEELAMSFCWNVSSEVDQARNGNVNFDVFPITFPTDNGDFELQGGIWGFGIFDNGNQDKINAAKTFIKYVTSDDGCYETAVLTSNFWAVRDMPDLYVNDKLMNEYGIFREHLGDYYQVTSGWADARTAWWQMLKSIQEGTSVQDAVEEFDRKLL